MASKKPDTTIPADTLELYDALLSYIPSIERKGKTLPYTSCNGHMFSFLSPEGILALRLPEKEREIFLTKFKTTLHKSHATIMKEYVSVPADLFRKPAELKLYLELSLQYVKSLKPKGENCAFSEAEPINRIKINIVRIAMYIIRVKVGFVTIV